MCSLCWADVFSFLPNVFTLAGSVFRLAGDVRRVRSDDGANVTKAADPRLDGGGQVLASFALSRRLAALSAR